MDEHYEGREQSAAKHLILRHYLEKLAFKVGFTLANVTLNYIDAFAGPWESKSAELDDTSPSIALRTLLEVKQTLAEKGQAIRVRAFFVSPSARGVEQLRALRSRFTGADVVVVQSKFEDALDAASEFARGGSNPFAFIFIDPTGWTGFGLRDITPLLRQRPGEVLINFMTEHIRRFADDDDARYSQSIVDLFGDAECRSEWRGLEHMEREERIIETYCRRIAAAGDFRHCVSSVVWKPTEDRSFFHLIYGTRNDEGLVTFRDAERAGIQFQRDERAVAKQRKRIIKSNTRELFGAQAMTPGRTFEDQQRERYLARAHALLDSATTAGVTVPWDQLLLEALRIPMVAEADVKAWLKAEQRGGRVEVIGLDGLRVPRRGHGHALRRIR